MRNRVSVLSAIAALAFVLAFVLAVGSGAPAWAQPFDLTKPVPECPPNEAQFTASPTIINLTWLPVDGYNPNPPDNHRYQVVITYPVPPILPPDPIIVEQPIHTFRFTRNGEYGWQIRVVEINPATAGNVVPATTAIVSPLSDQFTFTQVTGGPPPPECGSTQVPFTSAPVITAPEDRTPFVQSQVASRKILKWNPVPEFENGIHTYKVTIRYQVESVTQTFFPPETDATEISPFFAPSSEPLEYSWSVKVVSKANPNQTASPSSETRSFIVYDDYPSPPLQNPDLNGDGEANALDVFLLADSWYETSVSEKFSKGLDVVTDGIIDEADLLRFTTLVMRQPDDPLAAPLARPMLFDPPDNTNATIAEINAGDLILSWGEVPGTQVYEVQILGPRDFVLPVMAPATSVVFPNTSQPGVYQWTVTATAPGPGTPWTMGANGPARIISPPSLSRRINVVSGG